MHCGNPLEQAFVFVNRRNPVLLDGILQEGTKRARVWSKVWATEEGGRSSEVALLGDRGKWERVVVSANSFNSGNIC